MKLIIRRKNKQQFKVAAAVKGLIQELYLGDSNKHRPRHHAAVADLSNTLRKSIVLEYGPKSNEYVGSSIFFRGRCKFNVLKRTNYRK